ncbi:hypothetical protein [Streptomyces sp. NPDC058295]|uniref:hypothetical protein n=1 Tax=Streptomyces sp. NPDC058295 TaxID=3346431 RepID=UPI0036E6C7AE
MREHYDPARLIAYTNQTFAPDLAGHPGLLGLFHDSGLHELVTQLLHPALTAPVTTEEREVAGPQDEGVEQRGRPAAADTGLQRRCRAGAAVPWPCRRAGCAY